MSFKFNNLKIEIIQNEFLSYNQNQTNINNNLINLKLTIKIYIKKFISLNFHKNN